MESNSSVSHHNAPSTRVRSEWLEQFSELTVRTPAVELRVAKPESLSDLSVVAAEHVTPPSELNLKSDFRSEWDNLPSEQRANYIIERQRNAWERFSIAKWEFPFIVHCDNKVIGEVFLRSQNFREHRTFSTVTWLGEPWRNQGLGLEVRSAAIQFGFGALSANRVLAHSFQESIAATTVSKKLSYTLSGAVMCITQGRDIRSMLFYRLDRRLWEARVKRTDIKTQGMSVNFP